MNEAALGIDGKSVRHKHLGDELCLPVSGSNVDYDLAQLSSYDPVEGIAYYLVMLPEYERRLVHLAEGTFREVTETLEHPVPLYVARRYVFVGSHFLRDFRYSSIILSVIFGTNSGSPSEPVTSVVCLLRQCSGSPLVSVNIMAAVSG